MLPFLLSLLKGSLLAVVLLVLYLLYKIILVPYLFKQKFKKYPNVLVTRGFTFMVGDLQKEISCITSNKAHYKHFEEDAHVTCKYDLMAKVEGCVPLIVVLSNKAMQQVVELQNRRVIDRFNNYRGLHVLHEHGITPFPTTEDIIQRRRNMTKWFGLNSTSKFIPQMISCCQKAVDKMVGETETDVLLNMNYLTFGCFTEMLFGKDVQHLINKEYPYENPDGTVESIKLTEMLIRVVMSYVSQHFSVVS